MTCAMPEALVSFTHLLGFDLFHIKLFGFGLFEVKLTSLSFATHAIL